MKVIHSNLKMFSFLFIIITCLFYKIEANYSTNCALDCYCIQRGINVEAKCFLRGLNEFPNLSHLSVSILDLSSNQIDQFPRRYARQISLFYLDLSSNNMAYLDEKSLYGFNGLRVLNLSYNRFKHWSDLNPNTLLTYSTNLEQLNLSGNKLNRFNSDEQSRDEMLNSEVLKVLLLNNCEISDVGGNILAISLPKLKMLGLNHNPVKQIKTLHSSSLQTLEMQNCSLHELSENFLNVLPRLEVLDLGWNPDLKMDFQRFTKVPQLKELSVNFCNLEEINLKHLPQLITLNLKGNRLHSLTETTFVQNIYLEKLDLSENSMRYLHSQVFRSLSQLTELNLSYNELARLDPNLFQTNTRLLRLNLTRNAFENLGVIRSNSLQYIDLSWCEILHLDSQFFNHLPNIIRINLSNNLLKNFPNEQNSSSLVELDLSNCRLSAIHNTTFANVPKLEELKLNGNRFTTNFVVEYFEKNKNLRKLWLGDNPWICNCKSVIFLKFYQYLNILPKKIQDPENLQCVSPEQHFGKKWDEICDWNIDPIEQKLSAQILWTIFSFILFSVCTSFVLYWIGYEILRYWREKRAEEEFELNQDEMRTIRCYNERMLSQPSSSNALSSSLQISPLPSYEDALQMPKPVRTTKSLVNLTPKASAQIRRICTTCSFNEMQPEIELGLRYQSEEVISNRNIERSLFIIPSRRIDHMDHDHTIGRYGLSLADNRYPASNVRAQNLRSAEQIANFQSRENSPYSKRKTKHKIEATASEQSSQLGKNYSSEEDYLEVLLNDTEVIRRSPFARRKPNVPKQCTTRLQMSSLQSELLAPVETHFAAIGSVSTDSLQTNDYHIITVPDIDTEINNAMSSRDSIKESKFF